MGEALHVLLQAYKDGDLTGLAFVAMRRRGRYITEIVGSCVTNATLTRGAIGELTDKVVAMQHSVHHNDTR